MNSAQGQFVVTDPCLRTVILIENPIGADELSTYQNGIDSLQDYLNLDNFPDTESIRIEEDGYGPNQCGRNNYSYTFPISGNTVPYLNIASTTGTITFAPTEDNSDVGVVTVRLNISKKFYPTITNYMDHFVTIQANQDGPVEVTSSNPLCNNANIDISSSEVDDVFHLWGDSVDTVTPAFAEYTYSGVLCADDLIFFYEA